jgi:hypothetical protein
MQNAKILGRKFLFFYFATLAMIKYRSDLFAGFNTAKGDLVRSIMYPKPVDFKFTRHSYIYVALLFVISLGGMIYTLYAKVNGSIFSSFSLRMPAISVLARNNCECMIIFT